MRQDGTEVSAQGLRKPTDSPIDSSVLHLMFNSPESLGSSVQQVSSKIISKKQKKLFMFLKIY